MWNSRCGSYWVGDCDIVWISWTVHWFLDLFSHFRVQYMQICLVLIGIALWKRRNKRAVALMLLACLNYAFVFRSISASPLRQQKNRSAPC